MEMQEFPLSQWVQIGLYLVKLIAYKKKMIAETVVDPFQGANSTHIIQAEMLI